MNSTKRWRIAQYFEIRWWKRYLRHKTPEDYLASKKKYWHTCLDELETRIEVTPAAKILDVGAGPAGIFIIWDNHKIDAIDPLFDEYEKHLPHFSKKRYKNVSFHTMAFEQFSTETKYDLIFCLNAINHFIDAESSLQKLAALAAPGGILVLSVDTHSKLFFRPFFRLLPIDILHPHQFSLDEFISRLNKLAGFEISEVSLSKKGFFFNLNTIILRKAI